MVKRSVVKRSTPRSIPYNDTTAHQDCLHTLNTTVFQLCETVPDLDVTPYVDNCAKDAVVTLLNIVKVKRNAHNFTFDFLLSVTLQNLTF